MQAIAKLKELKTGTPATEQELTQLYGIKQLNKGETLSVIGAGISGLSLAWFTAKSRPDVKVEIYEPRDKVGGWMGSKQIDLPDGSKTVFESGPRTLIPFHVGTILIQQMLSTMNKQHILNGLPFASDTNQKAVMYNEAIQLLPETTFQKLWFGMTNPLMRGTRFRLFADLVIKKGQNINDESVHSFISRRVGNKMASTLCSAMMRGIYGADADKISIKSVARLNRLQELEQEEGSSLIKAVMSGRAGLKDKYTKTALPLLFQSVLNTQPIDIVKGCSMLGLKDGIQGLAQAIADDLESMPNVKLHLNSSVEKLEPSNNGVKMVVNGKSKFSDLVISTVPKPQLYVEPIAYLLSRFKYTSIAVVNMWLPEKSYAKNWFGILVPQTEDYWNENRIMGILFDSSVKNSMAKKNQPKTPGSNMTVMLGMNLWDSPKTKEQCKQMAINGLQHILGPFNAKDGIYQVNFQTNAIPLYEVGHQERVKELREQLAKTYNNSLRLNGTMVGRGTGVSDCVVDSFITSLRFTNAVQYADVAKLFI